MAVKSPSIVRSSRTVEATSMRWDDNMRWLCVFLKYGITGSSFPEIRHCNFLAKTIQYCGHDLLVNVGVGRVNRCFKHSLIKRVTIRYAKHKSLLIAASANRDWQRCIWQQRQPVVLVRNVDFSLKLRNIGKNRNEYRFWRDSSIYRNVTIITQRPKYYEHHPCITNS